jgi:hypothetical protein
MAGYCIPSNDAKFDAWFNNLASCVMVRRNNGGNAGLDAHPQGGGGKSGHGLQSGHWAAHADGHGDKKTT